MKIVLAFALLLSAGSAAAQGRLPTARIATDGPPVPLPPEVISRDAEGRVTVRGTRITEPIKVDGKLDDPVYAKVKAVSDFIQQEPRKGEPASQKTDLLNVKPGGKP